MTPEQIQTAAVMRVQGASYNQIGQALNLDGSGIFRTLKKDQLQHIIKQAQTDLIESSLSIAVQNQANKIKAGAKIAQAIQDKEEISNGSVKLMELAHDSEKQLLQSVGIHPSHTQSIQINNILVDNRQELSPAIESLLSKHLQVEGNVIDVESGD